MIALRDAAEDYLQMRRALGYKLEIQGLLLRSFVSYLRGDRCGNGHDRERGRVGNRAGRRGPVVLGRAAVGRAAVRSPSADDRSAL